MDNKWFVVVNGREGELYDFIGNLTISPDGQRVAYAAQMNQNWFVVVDEEEQKPYDGIGTIVFSPNSQRMAYVAQRRTTNGL